MAEHLTDFNDMTLGLARSAFLCGSSQILPLGFFLIYFLHFLALEVALIVVSVEVVLTITMGVLELGFFRQEALICVPMNFVSR